MDDDGERMGWLFISYPCFCSFLGLGCSDYISFPLPEAIRKNEMSNQITKKARSLAMIKGLIVIRGKLFQCLCKGT
ncbi:MULTISPECIES: hypothetical protein [unclassified Moorena]|uniref:hypothetical protein n=1 Tax=unclassified Moorena TaxID=2683338 RepID=UPI0005C87AD4|nr:MULTISPECIES: hypothetical protein [unclassified Moorena]NEP33173.1 hypothetical protein [Moorena sp. SIO3B2]NER88963.1 hypothetical protein [Moorena sp. SIO3A2]NES42415.1 hypothetical protein [Moorena sp. SIO2C4]OLT64198.1 hypothetical protein BI334_03410 [Moorena producens 3L]